MAHWIQKVQDENKNLQAEKERLQKEIEELKAGKPEAVPVLEVPPQAEVPKQEAQPEPQDAIGAAIALAKKKGITPTRPWEKKDNATPWRTDTLKLSKTREGFHARWVKAEKIETRMLEGYTVADRQHYELFQSPLNMGTQTTSYLTRGDLVLMEIPSEGKKAREAAMEAKIKRQSDDAKVRVHDEARAIAKQIGVSKVDVFDEGSVSRR